jgi:hypothetical protein
MKTRDSENGTLKKIHAMLVGESKSPLTRMIQENPLLSLIIAIPMLLLSAWISAAFLRLLLNTLLKYSPVISAVAQVAIGIATVVIAWAGYRIARETLDWNKLSDEEKRGVHLKRLLKDAVLIITQPLDRPGPNLAVSHPEKLKKHKRFIPLVVETTTGSPPKDTLILETAEPTNRWTFRCDTGRVRILYWNKGTEVTGENPRRVQYSLSLWTRENRIGDICLNDLTRPPIEAPFQWKLSCNGIVIKEGQLVIP